MRAASPLILAAAAACLGAETAKEQSVAKVSRDVAHLHEPPKTYLAPGLDERGARAFYLDLIDEHALVVSGEHGELGD